MPPKKVTGKDSKANSKIKKNGKNPSKKKNIVKPVLKKPSIIKIRIPSKNIIRSTLANIEKQMLEDSAKSEAPVKNNNTLNLMNEVVNLQFKKKEDLFPGLEVTTKVLKKNKSSNKNCEIVKNNKSLKKTVKLQPNNINPEEIQNTDSNCVQPKKKRKKTESLTIPEQDIEKMAKELEENVCKLTPTKKKKPKIVRAKPKVIPDKNISEDTEVRYKFSKRKYKRKEKSQDVISEVVLDKPCSSLDQQKSTSTESVLSKQSLPDPMVVKFSQENKRIQSRANSVTSSEALSWTKDISSSSTTSCYTVLSSDIVRIDKKLPVLKVQNIDDQIHKFVNRKDKIKLPSNSQSSKKSHSGPKSSKGAQFEAKDFTLNLSTSSTTSKASTSKDPIEKTRLDSSITTKTKIQQNLEKLSLKLKSLDLDVIDWPGYKPQSSDLFSKQFQTKALKVLKEENNIAILCQDIKNVLSGKCLSYDSQTDVILNKNHLTQSKNDSIDNTGPCNGIDHDIKTSSHEVSAMAASDYNCNDDDDALSLYAESITSIVPSKSNSTAQIIMNKKNRDFEEYIPEPICKETRPYYERLNYYPSRIDSYDTSNLHANKNKLICEKQTADSTSLNRELCGKPNKNFVSDGNKIDNLQTFEKPILYKHTNGNSLGSSSKSITNCSKYSDMKIRPTLMADMYQTISYVKSEVFRNICFFNLIAKCKKDRCLFPHVQLKENNVKCTLSALNQSSFIQEYMLIRINPLVRNSYGKLYVEECIRRRLPRIFVEMALDFVTKRDNENKKVDIIETVLLALNTVNLDLVKDILQIKINTKEMLCDIFMRTLAMTQNFSRFKIIFMNLSDFIVKIGNTIDLDVSSLILERVSILPFEAPLANSLLRLIEHSDVKIFEQNMMAIFENQLKKHSIQQYDRLLEIKNRKNQINKNNSIQNLNLSQNDLNNSNDLLMTNRDRTYTSPDTTDITYPPLKQNCEPVFKRTIKGVFDNAERPNNSVESRRTKFNTFKQSPWRSSTVNPPMRRPHPMDNTRNSYVMRRSNSSGRQSRFN